jgi:uroporphyrinogen-III synthase
MTRMIILRPEPAASVTAAQAETLGFEPVKVPLFATEKLSWTVPDPAEFDGILLTSANALRYAGPQLNRLKTLPVYAVGPVTAQAAKAAGFRLAAVGQRGVGTLLSKIRHDLRLVHLAGEDRLDYRLAWQKIAPINVYRSAEIEDVDPALIDGKIVLVHSPRSGRRLAELVAAKRRASMTVVAISEAAATASGDGWARVAVAERPLDSALLALAAKLCDKPAEG